MPQPYRGMGGKESRTPTTDRRCFAVPGCHPVGICFVFAFLVVFDEVDLLQAPKGAPYTSMGQSIGGKNLPIFHRNQKGLKNQQIRMSRPKSPQLTQNM
jgi:hypothetical protein